MIHCYYCDAEKTTARPTGCCLISVPHAERYTALSTAMNAAPTAAQWKMLYEQMKHVANRVCIPASR